MIRTAWTTRIARAPEEVFDYLADLRNEPQWNPDAADVVLAGGAEIGRGTTFELTHRSLGRHVSTIARYERPRALAFDVAGPRTDARVTYEFADGGNGATEVLCEVELRLKGLLRLTAPFHARGVRRRVEHTRGPLLRDALERPA